MVDMEEGRRNQIRSFFGCTLGERNEKYKKKNIKKKNVFIGIYFFVFKHFLNDLKR